MYIDIHALHCSVHVWCCLVEHVFDMCSQTGLTMQPDQLSHTTPYLVKPVILVMSTRSPHMQATMLVLTRPD